MAQSIGELYLELGLNADSYNQTLNTAFNTAQRVGREIQGKLNLTPKVDDRALTNLNKHLDLKVAHFRQVQQFFNNAPLTPRVNLSELDKFDLRLKQLQRTGNVSIKVSLQSNDSESDLAAEKIAEKTGNAVEKAISKAMQRSITSSVISGIASSVGGIVNNTVGSIVRGSFEKVGRDLASGLSGGISQALESATGGAIGSTELLGKKIGASLSKSITSRLPSDLKSEIKDAMKNAIGDESILIESLSRRGTQRQRSLQNLKIAREQGTVERRDDLRNLFEARSQVTANQQSLTSVQGAQVRGETLRQNLESQKAIAEFERNAKRVSELDAALKIATTELEKLSNAEILLIKKQQKLATNARAAEARVKSSKKAVEAIQPQAIPKTYQDAIIQATGGKMPAEDLIPKLVVADERLKKAGANAQYGIESNTIQVTKQLNDAIQRGNLTADQMYALMEELHHAADYGFGRFKGVQANRQGQMLRPMVNFSAQEYAQVAPELQLYDPKERESELNAKVRARRDVARMLEQQKQSQGASRLEGVTGVAGVNYQPILNAKLAVLRGNAKNIEAIAASMKMGMGEGVDNFVDAIDQIEVNAKGIKAKLSSVRHLSGAEVDALQQAIGQQFLDIEKLSEQFPEIKKQFLQHVDETQRLRKQAARQEKIQAVGQAVGGVARGTTQLAQNVISSKPVQAIGGAAKLGYSVLQGAESLALDMIPFGRTLKGVGQQVVIPAAMFGAAQHLLPGGEMLAGGANAISHGAITPFAQGASSAMTGGMANFVSHAVPNVFGMQAQITAALTGSINALVSGTAGAIADVGTAVIGGKLIQTALSKPIQATVAQLPQVAAKTQFQLPPAAQKQLEPTSALTVQNKQLGEASKSISYETGKIARIAADNVGSIAEQIRKISPEQALARSQDISVKFRAAFAKLKEAQKQGNTQLAGLLAQSIQEMAESAKKEIAGMTSALGKDAGMGTKLGSQLAQAKSQISQAYNKTSRYNIQPSQGDAGEEATKQQLNLGKVVGSNPVNQLLVNAENASDRFDAAFKRIDQASSKAFQNQAASVNQAVEAIAQGAQQAQNASGKFSFLAKALDTGLLAFAAFQAVTFVGPMLARMANAATQTAMEFEALERSIGGGNLNKGAEALRRVTDEANRLGLNAKVAAQGYVQLANATRDTPLEGTATDQVFTAIQSASSAYSLTPERQKLINTGISQMASKGVVSMEELRQQIGESLPGAMQIAARSMNMTTAEFNKLVSSGRLLSEEFLPKFAQQLNAEVAVAAESAANSAQGSFNRLQNAITELQVGIGKGSLPVKALGADAIAATLALISKNASVVLSMLTAIGLMVSANILTGLYKIGIQLGLFPALTALTTNGFRAMGGAIATATGKFLLLTVALQAAGKIWEGFQDKSIGGLKEIGDTSQKTAEKLTQNSQQAKEDKRSNFDKWFNRNSDTAEYLLGKKEAADTAKSIASLVSGTQVSLQEGLKERNSSGINRLKEIEATLDQNRLQQKTARINSPDNVQLLSQLKQQESELLKQQESLGKRSNEVKAALAQNIQGIKQAISDLENKPEYVEQVANLKKLLQQAEQEQSDLNKAIDSSSARLERFNRSWENIVATLADAKTQIELTSLSNSSSILSAESKGEITQGQSQSMQQLENQRKLGELLAKNRQAIAQLNAELNSPEAAQTLSTLGVTSQTGQAQLKVLSERINTPKEKELLEKVGQLRELEAEAAKSQADLVGAQNEASRQVRESRKAIDDFFRGVARQSQELAYTLKAMDLDTRMNEVKAKIKGAMTGFYGTFVDEFSESLISIFEMGQEKLRNMNDAQQQLMQRMNGLEDLNLQAAELQRGLPGSGMFGTSGSAAFQPIAQIHKQHFIDDSPTGSYDFTLERNGKFNVGIPSPVSGRVTQAGSMSGYGNVVAVQDEATGKEWFMAHLEKVSVQAGQTIVKGMELGIQGTTGRSSGEHVHAEIWNKPQSQGGQRITDRGITRPMMEGYLGFLKQGSAGMPQNNIVSTGRGIDLSQFFAGGSNSMAAKVIGMAEGNRTSSGGYTQYAQGHTDPGNGKFNIGSFSAQGSLNRGSIAASDEAVINELLKPYANKLAQQASRVGVQVTPKLLLNYLDTLNQGGQQVVEGWNDSTKGLGFLGKLAMVRGRENDDEAIRKLRVESYRNTSGRLETTFNGEGALSQDQLRRMGELNRAQSAFGLGRSAGSPMKPTTGMTVGSIADMEQNAMIQSYGNQTINTALEQARADNDRNREAIMANAESKNLVLSVNQRNLINRARKQLKRDTANVNVQAQEAQRQNFDLGSQTGDRTPARDRDDALRQLNQQRVDSERKSQDTIDQLNEENKKMANMIKLIKESPALDPGGLLPTMEESLNHHSRSLRIIQQEQKTSRDKFKARQDDIINQFNREEAKRLAEGQSELTGLQNQSRNLRVDRMQEGNAVINPDFNPIAALKLQRDAQISARQQDTAKQLRDLDDKERNRTLGESLDIYKNIREQINAINDLELSKIDREFEKLTKQAELANKEMKVLAEKSLFDATKSLASEQVSSLKLTGLDTQAADYEKLVALAQNRFDLEEQIRSIDADKQGGKWGERSIEVADQLKQIYTDIFNLKDDNIKRQFSELTQIANENKGAFQGFFSSLLTGSKSVGDAFKDMIGQIAGNLANMASKRLTDEIFGLFQGKDKKTTAKQANDLLGMASPATTYDDRGREITLAANQGGLKFFELSQQAGESIVLAGQQFAELVSVSGSQPFSFGGESGLSDFKLSSEAMNFDFASTIDTAGYNLFTNAENASFSIMNGAEMASEYLSDAGTSTSDNLLGGLEKGLPGILQSVFGAIGGKGAGGFGGILGTLLSPVIGGLFGGGGSGLGGLDLDLASPVLNFKDGGGISSDGRTAIDAKAFKNASNSLGRAIRREGRGAMISVLNDREFVLNENQAAVYFGLGLDRIVDKGHVPNFRLGGFAGSGSGGAATLRSGNTTTINIPVTVTSDSGLDARRISEVARASVRDEIARQQRAGGQLYQ